MLIQPFPDCGMLVCRIVIADQVQLLVLRCLTINLAQELQPLNVAVPLLALPDHCPVQHIECGKQSGCAMTLVIMCLSLNLSRAKLQFRLGPIKSLNLGLFVNRQNQCIIRGGFIYSPTTSQTFSAKWGSLLILNVLSRCGFKSAAFQI